MSRPISTGTKSRRRGAGILLGLLSLILIWSFWPRDADLRGFDPAGVARLESRMWRSYYEKRRLPLVLDLYCLARAQYHFSPWDSARIAWHATRAAVTFQPTRSRAEAQAALPSLHRYFQILSGGTGSPFDPAWAAREELEWWQQRREDKVWPEYAHAVARVTATLYGTSEDRVLEFAQIRSEMMDERDGHRDTTMTDTDWERIEAGLARSWASLKRAVE